MRRVRVFLFSLCLLAFYAVCAEVEPDVTVSIPMRDGITLPTDIYLPSPDANRLPCILVRSPSGRKSRDSLHFGEMSKWGYVVAIQDTRNIMDPEGKTLPYLSDAEDGYDTVQWLASSQWCNGDIGTIGASAQGISELLMAPAAPPHLRCQYVKFAGGSLYHHVIYGGGTLHKEQVESWLKYYARHPSVLTFVLNQPHYNDFWQQFDTIRTAGNIHAPAIHVGGWYDIFLQGTIDTFRARQEKGGDGARFSQQLVIGPWTHFWPLQQTLGEFPVPAAAQELPKGLTAKDFFDRMLKGVEPEQSPKAVTYYVMGPFDGSPSSGNVWKTADRWPVPATTTSLFLANKGTLSDVTVSEPSTFSLLYDPMNPIPTIGGRNLFIESGPKDQRPLESRNDVLVFTSAPLVHDVEVTGNVSSSFFVTTDRENTDVTVRLCDVYPDGKSILITDGIQKISGEGNTPQEVWVDLGTTSIVFAKGHCIRILIAGSNYPRFEKSLNGFERSAGCPPPTAHTTLFAGPNHPSRLVLPVVRNAA